MLLRAIPTSNGTMAIIIKKTDGPIDTTSLVSTCVKSWNRRKAALTFATPSRNVPTILSVIYQMRTMFVIWKMASTLLLQMLLWVKHTVPLWLAEFKRFKNWIDWAVYVILNWFTIGFPSIIYYITLINLVL